MAPKTESSGLSTTRARCALLSMGASRAMPPKQSKYPDVSVVHFKRTWEKHFFPHWNRQTPVHETSLRQEVNYGKAEKRALEKRHRPKKNNSLTRAAGVKLNSTNPRRGGVRLSHLENRKALCTAN